MTTKERKEIKEAIQSYARNWARLKVEGSAKSTQAIKLVYEAGLRIGVPMPTDYVSEPVLELGPHQFRGLKEIRKVVEIFRVEYRKGV